MMRIVDAADSDLEGSPLSEDLFPTTAETGVMNRPNLGATKPLVSASYGCQLLKMHIDERSSASSTSRSAR